MTIDELELSPAAKNAAKLLQNKYPHLKFTSKRRNIREQAHAMAGNVVHNRQWIIETSVSRARRWSEPVARAVQLIAARFQPGTHVSSNVAASGRGFQTEPVLLQLCGPFA